MLTRPIRAALRVLASVLMVSAAFFTASCVNIPQDNPAFPLTIEQASAELARLRANPSPPERPVVVLAGYRAPSLPGSVLAAKLRELTGAPRVRIIAVSYQHLGEFPAILRHADEQIRERLPEAAAGQPIDVVGISMGGLVARALADGLGHRATVRPGSDQSLPEQPLNIANIYTLATPHRGAIIAERVAFEPAARDMRSGSGFLAELDAALPDARYTLVPYVRLRDAWVGATRAAPPGREPVWTSGRLLFTHFTVHQDERILADLARRLRGEAPLGQPSTPPRD
jgi:pimeloyl-ACP methyl ester carboxylesterase